MLTGRNCQLEQLPWQYTFFASRRIETGIVRGIDLHQVLVIVSFVDYFTINPNLPICRCEVDANGILCRSTDFLQERMT